MGDRASRIELVRAPMPLAHLSSAAEVVFGDLVKAVVDVEQGVMAIGGELHADEEALLIGSGSSQADLWASTSSGPVRHPGLHRVRLDDQPQAPPGQSVALGR